jgi:uncharacterized membrane protein YczE
MTAPAPTPTPQTTRRRLGLGPRLTIFLVAIGLVGVGVALMVRADLGVAPNDVMNTGLAETVGWGVGTAAWVTAAIAMIISTALGRRPAVATVASAVVVGFMINACIDALPEPTVLGARIAYLVIGLVTLWVAITFVVATDVGAGPLEILMLAITDKGPSLRAARWGLELTLLAIGVALGGEVGLGTVAFALGTGPVLAATIPRATHLLGTQVLRPVDIAAVGP